MKLYLAGNPGHGEPGRHREEYFKKINARLMISYFWCKEEGDFHQYFRRMIKNDLDHEWNPDQYECPTCLRCGLTPISAHIWGDENWTKNPIPCKGE